MNARHSSAITAALVSTVLTLCPFPAHAQEKSRYMGGAVTLAEAPNGALINAETLEAASKIVYLEPTIEKLADGVWCIGSWWRTNSDRKEKKTGCVRL